MKSFIQYIYENNFHKSEIKDNKSSLISLKDNKSSLISLKDNKPSLISLNEKLIINKNYKNIYLYKPNTWDDLRQIIVNRYKEQGPGTEQNPIDFNDTDVSRITTFYSGGNNGIGLFQKMQFEYIDISDWDVSNIENMNWMFYNCSNLKSIGDISNWDVSKVKYMGNMFRSCYMLESVGDLSNWKVSNVENMYHMFNWCEKLQSVGDLSKWDISGVTDMQAMFTNSGIKNMPSWY